MADDEKIAQAIREEPRSRMNEAPDKRATEQDRHPNSASSASSQQEDEEEYKRNRSQSARNHVSTKEKQRKKEISQMKTRTPNQAMEKTIHN